MSAQAAKETSSAYDLTVLATWHSRNGRHEEARDVDHRALARAPDLEVVAHRISDIVVRGPLNLRPSMRKAMLSMLAQTEAPEIIDLLPIMLLLHLASGDLSAAAVEKRAMEAELHLATSVLSLGFAVMVRDMAELAPLDLQEGRLDLQGIAKTAGSLLSAGPAVSVSPPSAGARSRVALLVKTLNALDSGDSVKLLEDSEELMELAPDASYAWLSRTQALAQADRKEEARQLLAAARERFPGDPFWTNEVFTLAISAPTGELPRWASKAEGFEERLARVALDDVTPLEPRRRVHADQGLELWVPTSFGLVPGDFVRYLRADGRALAAGRFPVPTSCEPAECAKLIAPYVNERGAQLIWSAPTRVAAGEAHHQLATAGKLATYTLVLRAGSHFGLASATTPITQADELPALAALLRAGLRRSDAVLPTHRAEALRSSGSRSPPPGAAFMVRWDHGRSPKRRGCPLSAALGVAAALRDEAEARRFGRAVAEANPQAFVWTAMDALLATPEAGSHEEAPTDPLPPVGLLQLVSTLSDGEASRSLVERAYNEGERRLRTAAIASALLDPEAVSKNLMLAAIRSGSPEVANLAATGLEGVPEAGELDVLRRRVDSLDPGDRGEGMLMIALARIIARAGRPEDAARLKRLALASEEQTRDTPGLAVWYVSAVLDGLRRAHLSLGAERHPERQVAEELPPFPYSLVAELRSEAGEEPPKLRKGEIKNVARVDLRSIAKQHGWSYTVMPEPARFTGACADLWRRLGPRPGAEADEIRRTVARHYGNYVGRLDESDGFDLERPFECVVPASPSISFLCSAWIADEEAVRRHVCTREMEQKTSLEIPGHVQKDVLWLPMSAAMVADKVNQTGEYVSPERFGRKVHGERAVALRPVAGMPVEQQLVFSTRSNGEASVDRVLFLFAGERLFVFSHEAFAEDLLRAARSDDLLPSAGREPARTAGPPEVRGVMRGFNDDRRSTATVTVRPTVVGFESVVELPPDNLREASDVRDLLGRLPEGAATIFAWGIHRDDPHAIAPRWIATLHIEELGRPPPTLGVDLLPAVVLAWYPRRGGSILGGVLGRGSPLLWQEWLFLAPDDPETRRLLESHGVRFGAAGEIVHASAISAGHDDGVLVLSSKRELAQAALGRKATAPNDGRKVFMVLRADAKKAAEALERVAEGLGDELHLMGPARWYSKLLGAAERVEMVGVQEDPTGPGVIRARVDALLHEEEATAEDVKKLLEPDFPARDLRLPRRLRDEEHELKLTLVANVDSSAEVVERLQGRSSRLKVTALDPKSVRIQNLPAEKPDESVAVSELGGAEKRKTLKTEELPQALATRLDEVVSSAEREHSSTVDRALSMLRWVNGAMTYRTRRRSVPLEEVVAELHGDCTEYAALAVELLRRAGIPAKTKSGYVVTELGFGGHAWVAFHDGRGWREADPTGPSLRVGSGHFAFPLVGVSLVLDPRRFQIVEVRSEPR